MTEKEDIGVVNLSFEPVANVSNDQDKSDHFYDDLKTPTEADITCDYVCCRWSCLQFFRSPKCVVFWISTAAFLQVMVSVGFSSSTITSLERRYRLSSSEAGLILSLYEAGAIIVVLPISYFFTNSRRLRTVSTTIFIMGIGSLLYALPHFLTGFYVYDSPVKPICYRNETQKVPDFCEEKKGDSQLSQFKWMFMLGQFVMGAASPAAFTLGIPYLDDSLPANVAPFYLGFCYTSLVIGSAAGFLVGGSFMSLFVDVSVKHPELDPSNTKQWVGAWWIGFLMAGVLMILTAIPLFGFPKQLPGTKEVLMRRKSEAFGNSEKEAEKKKMTAADFLGNLKLLATNPTFVLLVVSSSIDQIKKSGFTAFGVKYFESNFGLTAATASLVFGVLLVVAGGSGIFLGGIVVRLANFRMRGLLRYIVIMYFLSLPLEFQLFIPCGPADLHEHGEAVTGLRFANASCNFNCQCTLDAMTLTPSCGTNNVTYFSPCYAGCTESIGKGAYGDCSCIPGLMNATVPQLRRGECTERCEYVRYFFITCFVGAFVNTLSMTAYITAILRSVPLSLKGTALGINTIFSKIMGQIPGPLLVGAIMDSACSLWTQRCGVKGNCAFYDHLRMRRNLFSVNIGVSAITFILLVAAMLAYRTSYVEELKDVDNECENTAYKWEEGDHEDKDYMTSL